MILETKSINELAPLVAINLNKVLAQIYMKVSETSIAHPHKT